MYAIREIAASRSSGQMTKAYWFFHPQPIEPPEQKCPILTPQTDLQTDYLSLHFPFTASRTKILARIQRKNLEEHFERTVERTGVTPAAKYG